MDSALVFILVMVGIALTVAAVFVIVRARGGGASGGGGGPAGGDTAADEEAAGPLHKDPDPERMAGGRARFTPPGTDV